jgi:hypothetical protein
MKRRGRRTKLDVKLQREICGYLSDCCTIRTACEATGMSESSFYLWVEKGEEGRSPYKEFSEAITRARGRAKARIVHSLLDEKDWRARLEVLARVFPDEYGRREPSPPPPAPPPPPPDLSKSIRLTCYGAPDVDLMQFMEMKAKLEAAGVKTDFPIQETCEPAHVQNDNDDLEPGKDVNGSPDVASSEPCW